MPDIKDMKTATVVARNIMRARNEYKASPDFLPDGIIRMDNRVNENLEVGLAAAEEAVSADLDEEGSQALLDFHALRREILAFYKTEMSIPQFLRDSDINVDLEDAPVDSQALDG